MFQHFDGRYSTIWSSIHWTVLYFQRTVGEPVLLLIWILIPRILYTCGVCITNINCYGVLSTVWRGNHNYYSLLFLYWKSFFVISYVFFCIQDYHWWWKSFVVSGGSAVYILIYSIFYFFTKLEITEFIPTLLYIGYTGNLKSI